MHVSTTNRTNSCAPNLRRPRREVGGGLTVIPSLAQQVRVIPKPWTSGKSNAKLATTHRSNPQLQTTGKGISKLGTTGKSNPKPGTSGKSNPKLRTSGRIPFSTPPPAARTYSSLALVGHTSTANRGPHLAYEQFTSDRVYLLHPAEHRTTHRHSAHHCYHSAAEHLRAATHRLRASVVRFENLRRAGRGRHNVCEGEKLE